MYSGKRKSFNFASRFASNTAGATADQADRKRVLTRGVIGNTSDFGSEESRFEPWRVNKSAFPVITGEAFFMPGGEQDYFIRCG